MRPGAGVERDADEVVLGRGREDAHGRLGEGGGGERRETGGKGDSDTHGRPHSAAKLNAR